MRTTKSDPIPASPPAAERRMSVEDWVRCHQRGVWRFLRTLGCPADEADDLMQETLLIALRRGLPQDDGDPRGFLRATARNLWLRSLRAQGRQSDALVAAAEAKWMRDCAADAGEGWLEDLDLCLSRLTERSRRGVELFYGSGLTRAELSAELGMSEHGARTLLQRARAALRECMEARGER